MRETETMQAPGANLPAEVFSGSSPSRAMLLPPSRNRPPSPTSRNPNASSHATVWKLKPSCRDHCDKVGRERPPEIVLGSLSPIDKNMTPQQSSTASAGSAQWA